MDFENVPEFGRVAHNEHTAGEHFRYWWFDSSGALHAIGELHLTFEVLDLVTDAGLSLVAYGTAPGTASEDGLHPLVTRLT